MSWRALPANAGRSSKPSSKDSGTDLGIQLIPPTVPEVRRLIRAMVGPEEQRDFKLGWSLFRRAHHAIGRRYHKESHQTKHAIRHDARGEPIPDPTDAPTLATTDAYHKEAGILTDAEWEHVSQLLPEQKPGQGRPRRDDRQVLCAILWVMNTGASWRELPEVKFGPNSTAHCRYRKWLKEGLWCRIVQALRR